MVSPDKFRDVVGSFTTGVTITTFGGDPPHGMTASAFSSVSLDPPLVLICIDHDTTSFELLENDHVNGFCVNVATEDQRHLVEHFAGMTQLEENPFEATGVKTAENSGAPVFTDSLAYLDCSRYSELDAGDHTIYVGEVEEAEYLLGEGNPLTFYRGGFGTVEREGGSGKN